MTMMSRTDAGAPGGYGRGGSCVRGSLAAAAAAGLLVLGAAGPASAQRRPDTLTMTCQQVGQLVQSRGAIILGTGPNIFDRYVADGRFCSLNEVAAPSPLRTRDNPYCRAANRCIPKRDYWEDNFFWR